MSRDALRASAGDPDVPLELKLAAKLVESRRILASLDLTAPIELGVVFAMWGEHRRLRPRTDANPHGEDLLRVKLDQLAWAARDTPIRWRVYAVDDGCPDDSAGIAREIARSHPQGERVHVSRLADALPAPTGSPLSGLRSADDSRKGGSVLLGCQQALDDGVQAVVYTDADTSVHLGQLGLLIEPWVARDVPVVLGNRKHPDAVLVKQEARWGPGIKLLRHMQRRIGEAIFSRGILDTQAAFKLYDRDVLRRILAGAGVYDFSFDTDWISEVLARDVPFETVPFAFVDSFEESGSIVQGPMTTWFALLKGLAHSVRAARPAPRRRDGARARRGDRPCGRPRGADRAGAARARRLRGRATRRRRGHVGRRRPGLDSALQAGLT